MVINQISKILSIICIVLIIEEYMIFSGRALIGFLLLIILLMNIKISFVKLIFSIIAMLLIFRIIFVKSLLYDYKETVRFTFLNYGHWYFLGVIVFFAIVKLKFILQRGCKVIIKFRDVLCIFISWIIFLGLYFLRPNISKMVWQIQPYGKEVYIFNSIEILYIILCCFFLFVLPAVITSKFFIFHRYDNKKHPW